MSIWSIFRSGVKSPVDGVLLINPATGEPVMPVAIAASAQDNAAVAVGDTATALLEANPSNIGLRLLNIGTDPAAIGQAGITWTKRVIVLDPGSLWIETEAPNLAWFAVCDAGQSASITSQELRK